MTRVLKIVLLLAAALLVLGGGGLTFWINILNGTQYSPNNDTTGTRRIVLSTTFTACLSP
jgi:hypothetical protein